MAKFPLIGYCDICGTTTKINSSPNGVANSDVTSDNRMEVFELASPSGNGEKRRLCAVHYAQEKMNNNPKQLETEKKWEDYQGNFQKIFPQYRHTSNK